MMQNSDVSSSASNLLLELIHEKTGHSYVNGSVDRLLDKLAPLVAERGLSSFLDYYYLLKYGTEAEQEWRRVENALAVNETYFWREYDQINVGAATIVTRLQQEHPLQSVRIWHAGCASGEEPYTMAITLQENGVFEQGPVEIIATDFNWEALALARAGVYRARSFRAIPLDLQQRYFTPEENGNLRLVDTIRRRVQFQQLNLMDEQAIRRLGNFDLIYCRNVFIYFSATSTRRVVDSFYNALRDPGYLFLAAAESLLRITDKFSLSELNGTFLYCKVVES